MSRLKLTAQPRDTRGKHVAKLRREGLLPGVVYGAGVESQSIQLDARDFGLLHRQAGRHAVLDLEIEGDGNPRPVLLQAVQVHPVTRQPLHIDLLAVNLEEERTVDAAIVMVGESNAVARLGGVLLHLRDSVSVRAKPDDLPSGIELDITPLEDFDAVLHVSDLRIPPGVTLITELSEPIARVQPPRVEEEPVATAEEAEAAEAAEGEEALAAEGEAGAESGEAAETSTEESA